jgi:hypothetical protein
MSYRDVVLTAVCNGIVPPRSVSKHCSTGGSTLSEGMASRGRLSVPFRDHP